MGGSAGATLIAARSVTESVAAAAQGDGVGSGVSVGGGAGVDGGVGLPGAGLAQMELLLRSVCVCEATPSLNPTTLLKVLVTSPLNTILMLPSAWSTTWKLWRLSAPYCLMLSQVIATSLPTVLTLTDDAWSGVRSVNSA